MRKQKTDYKSQKIMVAVTPSMKQDMENICNKLGVGCPALLRILFIKYQKQGNFSPAELISEV